MKAYPIKFTPIFKEKVWGGNKLKTYLKKNCTNNNIGESWEISTVQGNISEVSNGLYKNQNLIDLIKDHKEKLLGKEIYKDFGNEFPLLIKFLDAKENLSIQVHPDDVMAQKHHNCLGKNEMWYIMESDPNAKIVLGTKKNNLASNIRNINNDNVPSFFNYQKVKKDEFYHIPAGTIHALGAGVLAAEIQQTSDITYRIYDWDRVDTQGHKRELHIAKSIEALKIKEPTSTETKTKENNLVNCKYFTTNKLTIEGIQRTTYNKLDSFVIYICVEGQTSITTNGHTEKLNKGETVMLPAVTKNVDFIGKAQLLEVYITPLQQEKQLKKPA